MVDLPAEWGPVLDFLIKAPVAWQSPAAIALGLGTDVETISDQLSVIDVAGWISVWEVDEGPLVTLSALAAERLRVVLVEVGPEETPRWSAAGDPPPPRPKAKYVCRSEKFARLEGVADPHPSPDVAAENAERLEARAAELAAANEKSDHDRVPPRRVEDLPWPTLLLGQGLTPWPGPEVSETPDAPCPACGDHALRPHVYCLCCDRWGMDALLATLMPASARSRLRPYPHPPRRRRADPPQAPADTAAERVRLKQQVQSDRARRKARRKARRLARGA